AALADVGDGGLAVDLDQRAGARHVDVPDVVMDGLEVPLVLTGAKIHRDQRVAEQVRARALASPIVGGRAADRQDNCAALEIHRRGEGPHVRAGTALPAVAPSLVERLAGLRHRLEFPQLAAGTHVEATRVAGNADRVLESGGANYRHVAGDRDGSAVGDADIDHAVLAESCSRLT